MNIEINKKGFFLAENLIKIVIALICIGFLAYFLAALYFSNQNNKYDEQARATLDELKNQIDAGAESFVVYNPDIAPGFGGNTGYGFYFFKNEEQDSSSVPLNCINNNIENCLCVCNAKSIGLSFKSKNNMKTYEVCNYFGYCINTELPVELRVRKEDGVLTLSDKIDFVKTPFDLNLGYPGDSIRITRNGA